MIPAQGFVELDKLVHDRKTFDCGRHELNDFLLGSAARHREAGISLTMVLPEKGLPEAAARGDGVGICAWYTLSHTQIRRETLPASLAKKLPRYPLPVILIAQLAVHRSVQAQGLGKMTLVCALEHAFRIDRHLPSYAVVVDALDVELQAFYEQFGFQTLCRYEGGHEGRIRLFMSMKTVAGLFPAG